MTETEEASRRRLLRGRLARGSAVTAAASAVFLGVILPRCEEERQRRIATLPLASSHLSETLASAHGRSLPAVVCALSRTSLQGTSLPGAKSVKEELEVIRAWHHQHGFKGGIVLRELTKPLFRWYHVTNEDMAAEEDAEEAPLFDFTDPMRLARRECYYLYYELKDNGQLRQQIFCRGTTLSVDILTCLQSWWVYDEDCSCRVHCGFRNHADRMLHDILPLLAPPTSERATVELTGHSLGGAVAQLLAIKLRKRGYKVISVTSIAAPRYCASDAAATLQPLLPKNTLCIEDDRDIVPLLPPFAAPVVGDKLWLVRDGPARYIPADQRANFPWADSFLWNASCWSLLTNHGRPHRIRDHVARIERILEN
jgi:hypothetical protein